MITSLGDLVTVLRDADPTDKAHAYRQLGLQLTYQPDQRVVIADARPSAIMYEKCPRGDLNQFPTLTIAEVLRLGEEG